VSPTDIGLAADDPKGKDVNLETHILRLLSDQITRLPILDHVGHVTAIMHESMIFRFISDKTIEHAQDREAVDISSFTLRSLLDHDDNRDYAKRTIAFVAKDASLAEAKRRMEAVNKCQDIFVTEDGTPGTTAVGWITNVILSRHARA
jgi:hypothetical protein